jgi:kynurenine formamidase
MPSKSSSAGGYPRRHIGVFPWRFVGGEASICRVVAFLEA